MSLIALLVTIVVAMMLSNAMDAFPGVLWEWVHWPQWTLALVLLVLFAWCLEEKSVD